LSGGVVLHSKKTFSSSSASRSSSSNGGAVVTPAPSSGDCIEYLSSTLFPNQPSGHVNIFCTQAGMNLKLTKLSTVFLPVSIACPSFSNTGLKTTLRMMPARNPGSQKLKVKKAVNMLPPINGYL